MKVWHLGCFVLVGALAVLIAGNHTSAQDKKGKKDDKKVEPKKAPEIPPRQGKSETIKLFNGTDLEGWEGYKDLWSVKDGVIVAHNDKNTPLKVSTYLFTKQ